MSSWRAILISSAVLAGACCLLATWMRPADAPAVETAVEPALRRIEARLDRLEEAIQRLSRPAPGAMRESSTSRSTTTSISTSTSTPAGPVELAALPGEGTDVTTALRAIERRLNELRDAIHAGGRLGGAPAVAWEPPEEAPEDLQVRLDARLVDAGDALGIKVYWRILSGADSATEQDWIGLFAPGASDREYTRWKYTGGLPAGEVDLELPAPAGLYEARYFYQSGYARVPGASGPVQAPQVEPPAADEGEAKE